jgi:hypothetical protein
VTASAPRTCTACAQQLNDLSEPCPNCGSTRQTAHIGPSDSVGLVDGLAQITAIFGPNRSWSEKWLSVRKHLERVESACSANGYKGSDDVSRAFADFFIECDNMADWLGQDKSTGFGKTANNYRFNDRDLRRCHGAAIVAKHHTRDDPAR